MSIVVQVQERKLTVPLKNGDNTTAAEVVSELSNGSLSSELSGKELKLIFSGRVLEPRELITSVVPLGAVVQCAILGDRIPPRQNTVSPSTSGASLGLSSETALSDDSDLEAGLETLPLPGAIRVTATNRRRNPAQTSDFIWGFMLGFVVGPLMFFWLLEPAPQMQKLGICVGCIVRTLVYEYRQVSSIPESSGETVSVDSGDEAILNEINSFEVEFIPPNPSGA